MVCEYIEKGDYYIYYPEQCMAQNDNNLVFLSENGIKIEAFFQWKWIIGYSLSEWNKI